MNIWIKMIIRNPQNPLLHVIVIAVTIPRVVWQWGWTAIKRWVYLTNVDNKNSLRWYKQCALHAEHMPLPPGFHYKNPLIGLEIMSILLIFHYASICSDFYMRTGDFMVINFVGKLFEIFFWTKINVQFFFLKNFPSLFSKMGCEHNAVKVIFWWKFRLHIFFILFVQ